MPDKDRKALIAELQRKLSVLERNAGTNPPPVYSEYPKYVPKDIEPLYNKALSFSVSDSDSALYYFLQCLEINDCPLVNFRIGNMLYQQQDLAVLSYYDKAFDGFARDPDFLIRYCVAAKLNQELSKAKEIFSLLSAIAPRHPDLPRLMEALQQ